MANSRLTVNISRELVVSIAVIGNEKLQSAYLLEMMPWNHSLNTPLSSCTTPFGAWVSLNHWTALWNMIACQSLALIRDWSMSSARVPYQHIRQSDHLFWDKRSHPPESACVRDILGRSYNKELQRFSLPSPQVSLLRAAHASRSRDTNMQKTLKISTYAALFINNIHMQKTLKISTYAALFFSPPNAFLFGSGWATNTSSSSSKSSESSSINYSKRE